MLQKRRAESTAFRSRCNSDAQWLISHGRRVLLERGKEAVTDEIAQPHARRHGHRTDSRPKCSSDGGRLRVFADLPLESKALSSMQMHFRRWAKCPVIREVQFQMARKPCFTLTTLDVKLLCRGESCKSRGATRFGVPCCRDDREKGPSDVGLAAPWTMAGSSKPRPRAWPPR